MSETPKSTRTDKLLRGACYASLLALVLIVVSLFWPKPLAVIVAMSLGQVLGTASLAMFLFVVAAEFRRSRILDQAAPVSLKPKNEEKPQ